MGMYKVGANGTVNDYVRGLPVEQKAVAKALLELIKKAAPNAKAAIKWGVPWWSQNRDMFCIYTASDHINFGFYHAVKLDDPDDLLEGTGKSMRHIKIYDAADIQKTKFTKLIKQAVKLDMGK
jgi:hypothetical protein